MNRICGFLIAAASAAFLSAAPAAPQAPPACGEYAKVADRLASQHGEFLVMSAGTAGGSVELWVSAARTWTLLHVVPGGVACLIAAGQDLRFNEPPKAPGRNI